MLIKRFSNRLFSRDQRSELGPVSSAGDTAGQPAADAALEALDFQFRAGAAFDPASGLVIPHPRIQMDTLTNGVRVTEYQFAFYRNQRMTWRLGFLGPDALVDAAGHREWIFTFDLGHDWLVASVLDLKRAIRHEGDDLSFLRGLARGMALAYAGQPDSEENMRYKVITTTAALTAVGIPISRNLPVSPLGIAVLADVFVQSSPRAWPAL